MQKATKKQYDYPEEKLTVKEKEEHIQKLRVYYNHRKNVIPGKSRTYLPFIIFVISLVIMMTSLIIAERVSQKGFLMGEDGETKLAPWREKKLAKELEEIDDAEQYALVARFDDYYDCFNCNGEEKIFLKKGHIWRYGITRKGEKIRYRNKIDPRLVYFIQFVGSNSECLKEEKIKIYNYALLPENLTRLVPLIRPPGNKNDS